MRNRFTPVTLTEGEGLEVTLPNGDVVQLATHEGGRLALTFKADSHFYDLRGFTNRSTGANLQLVPTAKRSRT